MLNLLNAQWLLANVAAQANSSRAVYENVHATFLTHAKIDPTRAVERHGYTVIYEQFLADFWGNLHRQMELHLQTTGQGQSAIDYARGQLQALEGSRTISPSWATDNASAIRKSVVETQARAKGVVIRALRELLTDQEGEEPPTQADAQTVAVQRGWFCCLQQDLNGKNARWAACKPGHPQSMPDLNRATHFLLNGWDVLDGGGKS